MKFDNKKNSHLKPEDVAVGVEYTFTINPDDTRQYFGSPNRLGLFHEYWSKRLLELFYSKAAYWFEIEISSNGRLHMHGIVRIENIQALYLYTIPALVMLGSTEMDTIEDRGKWVEYMLKQAKLTSAGAKTTMKSPEKTPPLIVEMFKR